MPKPVSGKPSLASRNTASWELILVSVLFQGHPPTSRNDFAIGLTCRCGRIDTFDVGRVVRGIDQAVFGKETRKVGDFQFNTGVARIIEITVNSEVEVATADEGASALQRLDRPNRPRELGQRSQPAVVGK